MLALLVIAGTIAASCRVRFPFALESRGYTVGTASALALIDTPRSRVVDLGSPSGSVIKLLSDRARLLASLMVSSPISDDVARRVGLPPKELITMQPSTLVDRRRRVAAPQEASVGPNDPRAYILHVGVTPLVEGDDPIIAVDTQAPDAAQAAKLADQAIAALEAHLADEAVSGAVPPERRLVVRRLQPPVAATEHRGPSTRVAVLGGLGAFVVGTVIILLVVSLRRRPAVAPRPPLSTAA